MCEAEILEVLHVGGGKFLDSLAEECECRAHIDNSPAGERRAAGHLPNGIVQRLAFRWKSQQPPTGVSAIGPDHSGGIGLAQGAIQNRRVPQEHVKFNKRELGDGHIFPAFVFLQKTHCCQVIRTGGVQSIEQDIGINSQHESGELRLHVVHRHPVHFPGIHRLPA